MPPNLLDAAVLPFTFLLTLTAGLLLLNRKHLPASHFILLSGLGGLSLLMTRNIPLFVLACAPIVSELGSASLAKWKVWNGVEDRFTAFGRSAGQLISVLIVLFTCSYFLLRRYVEHRSLFEFNAQVFPVDALNWLDKNPQLGNMFNEFNWGGYILYKSWPQQRVFVDSQSDFYGEPLMREYDQVVRLSGSWEAILRKYDVRWIIVQREAPLGNALSASESWEILYRDQTATILSRK
jgi:hypothetical protein